MTIENDALALKGCNLSRREFFLRGTELGLGVLAGATWWLSIGDEITYQWEKRLFRSSPKESTVLLSLVVDREKGLSLVFGGVLLNEYNILTTAHGNVNKDFSYAQGKEFVEIYKKHQQVNYNIERVIKHPNLDLAVVNLNRPETGRHYTEIYSRPIYSGEGPLTLSTIRTLTRQEVYAGAVAFVDSKDQFGTSVTTRGVLVARNSASSEPGDSGSPLFLENQNKLVGICSGRAASVINFLNPKSYYVNLTEPSVKEWIISNLK